MQFTTNRAGHKSPHKAVIQLDPPKWLGYDAEFKTHIAIMGDYLVVLTVHYTYANNLSRNIYNEPRKYQMLYLIDWVEGHVIHVRTHPFAFKYFFRISNV
jgi:hypothetical protein